MQNFKTWLLLALSLGLLNACGSKPEEKPSSRTEAKNRGEISTSFRMPQLSPGNVKASLRAYGEENPEDRVKISTEYGDIIIELYEQTPLHRANFIYLTKKGFFNGTVFYRILKDFVIQGGSSDFPQREAIKKKIGTYRVPPELVDGLIHRPGAVGMAKKPGEGPEIGSTPYDFYIVLGERYTPAQLQALAQQEGITWSGEQTEVYTTQGGVPSLDGLHTVFGLVVEGMDVVKKIAAVKTRKDGWPEDGLIQIQVETITEGQ